jgi:hypothetical protein
MSLSEASDPSTKPARLVELSKSEETFIVKAVAKNPSTPVETLLLLAETHPTVPSWVSDSFTSHPDSYFLASVAGNPDTPISILELLATNPHENVRINMAINANAPSATLERLATDIALP